MNKQLFGSYVVMFILWNLLSLSLQQFTAEYEAYVIMAMMHTDAMQYPIIIPMVR
jgi:hypothetical protein